MAGVDALLAALTQAAGEAPCVFIGEREPGGSDANFLLAGSDASTATGALQVAASLPGARIVAELFTGELCAKVVEAIADGADGMIARALCAQPAPRIDSLAGGDRRAAPANSHRRGA